MLVKLLRKPIKIFNILILGLDRQGPTTLAMDLAYAAANNGLTVNFLYLKEKGNSLKTIKTLIFRRLVFINYY